ncbi:hypothetical protein SAMN02745248_00263 [Hathewaya proteolytica DSM 3090]|uniref:Lipoprotein n=1 Tax=Hathewaya proteolytica DSM 3090 TaxID=1121331 RepID=A0A1M6JNX7_9CLOT|nr:hypothetical protein [Hathewaya proteolytica]SHJ48411.1 hypothetical protein SAMN02745248_00263 [Hathewaya proteolytica DSM 3090]
MKHTKKLIASILFSLLICNFYGCGNKPNEAASEEKVTAKEKVASKEEISNNVSKLEKKENNSVSKVENKLSQKTRPYENTHRS